MKPVALAAIVALFLPSAIIASPLPVAVPDAAAVTNRNGVVVTGPVGTIPVATFRKNFGFVPRRGRFRFFRKGNRFSVVRVGK